MRKGIGPHGLGSPLKQTKKKGGLSGYLKGEQGYIPDALTGGKPTRQAMNESTLFNPRSSSEHISDMNDSRTLGRLRREQNQRDDEGQSTSAGQKRHLNSYIENSKKIRPNKKNRY